ncbi:hypothetical protein RO3G_05567 [Lichtheimia corymbifera JMRC:FSU:9682]|uniref:Protein kinase domain-containing protein n=1 Tax=Lichtheimia corymbifera JMRC:FSU:9682 TaxID=1263082 RepID=A0A068RJM2_9FUNG|nr:hypothetical protein RO3G_05567 [Lichtheimia corymbifera JMRC:FSU:9682]
MLRRWTIAILLLAGISIVEAQLGTIQTNVPWRAGHVAVYLDPYVILYGGSEDTSESYGGTVHGSNSLWVWDSRNGSWYNAQSTVQSGVNMLPQVYFGATTLPSSGQMIVVGGNTTGGGTSGMLQKLDINNWSWSFPSSNTASPTRAAQFAITTVNNTVYTYGGSAVDTNGFLQSNAVLNDLYMLDANSFGWTSGSNGAAITGHSTCYIKSCNCLVVFGGTSTGNGADANANVIVYDLTKRAWNLQVAVGGGSSGPPGGRVLHTANCMDDKMIVYGGGSPSPSDSDVWVLDASSYPTLTWERMQMENISQGPSARMGHTAVLDKANQKLYIFGGWGATATSDTHMYVLDAVKWSWSKIPTTGFSSSDGSSGNGDDNGGGGSGSSKTGAIVGGVVGGVVGAALIAALLFLLWRRRRKQQQKDATKDDMSEKSGNEYYATGWYYDGGDDQQSDTATGSPNRKRVSKAMTAMTNSLSFRDSYGVRSELGDTERVVTGVLEELPSPMVTDSGSEMATYSNGTRSYRDSAHNSKALLLPTSPSDVHLRSCGNQVPNEVLSQKPNEFSMPASRFAVQHDNGSGQTATTTIPIEHYSPQSPTSITASAGAPLSSSMDVLQSVRSGYGSSMLSPTEQAMRSRDGITVTHATHNADNPATKRTSHDEDNTTYTESISYQAQGSMGPIRYIPPSSQQFSLATTTSASASGATNDARRGSNAAIPLTHHQYPSSNMSSVPMARPITPDNDNNNNNTTHRISMHRFQHDTSNSNTDNSNNENIYETVSPLEMLAALGRVNEEESGSQSAVDSNEIQSSGSVATPAQSSSGNATDSTSREHMVDTKKDLSSRHRPESMQDAFSALAPLTSMLPRRYQLDQTTTPIIGPMNSILFINKVNNSQSPATTNKVAIKSFGRREAWERECRTLIKLKSPHVVELLEVLTIQDESRTPLPRRRQSISSSTSQPSSIQQQPAATNSSQDNDDEDEDQVKYVTVLERLDETLGSAIRRARSEKYAWTTQQTRAIARNVIECLAWCHSRGIAFCDLKPSNIMRRSADASWKLIDFEASRTIGEECVGVITPRYCPPEVARATTYGLEGANGVVATPSVDLWALGCVIYELETKHALFAGNIKDETILHFISHPSPSTPILNNGLRWNEHKELYIPNLERKIPDTRTRQLIKMLLSREPSKRGSASTLLDHPYFEEQQ